MMQDTTARILTQDKAQEKGQESQAAIQTDRNETAVESYKISWPEWPTSKPGPRTTPSPAGTKPINAIRREQVTPVVYDQETGTAQEPEEDARLTGEQMLGKRKQRL